MALERERKFLVRGDGWRKHIGRSRKIKQAYLARKHPSVRVRIIDNNEALLTIKSEKSGHTRHEFEYRVPLEDARAMIELRDGGLIEKTRHIVPAGELKWEVDVFEGRHNGLVIAEIELRHDKDEFNRPEWLGQEVTEDARYYNQALAADADRDD